MGAAVRAGRDRLDDAATDQTRAVTSTALAFFDTLGPAQRAAVRFPLGPPVAERVMFRGGPDGRLTFAGERCGEAVWSNFPVSDVPRPGLALGTLDRRQLDAALTLVAALLSPAGYRTVLDIMESDHTLAERSVPYACGVAHYTLGLFGAPDETRPWMVQFGGHHLALNVTVAGSRGVLSPLLTGAQPCRFRRGAETVRALAPENDRAFALLHSLDAGQRAGAVLSDRAADVLCGPGRAQDAVPVEGLPGHAMDARQKALLLDLIAAWVGILNAAHAAPRLAEIAAGLDDTSFAWHGPTTCGRDRNGVGSFRIVGPTLAIAFAPQRPGGDPTEHVHTVYRDRSNDYGRAWRSP